MVRFADRSGHQIFLEPEGLDDHTVYPNGVSTSLPVDVQDAFLRTMPGLEDVVITRAPVRRLVPQLFEHVDARGATVIRHPARDADARARKRD